MNKFMPVSEKTYEIIKHDLTIKYSRPGTLIDYNELNTIIPKRSTEFSAGYDFYLPYDVVIRKALTFQPLVEIFYVYTLMRCQLDNDKVLMIFPRSGLGIAYSMRLANTVGIIDADYFNTKNNETTNDGHIILAFQVHNPSDSDIVLYKGTKIAQGVILPYYKTDDDDLVKKEIRNGGFGSTGI